MSCTVAISLKLIFNFEIVTHGEAHLQIPFHTQSKMSITTSEFTLINRMSGEPPSFSVMLRIVVKALQFLFLMNVIY
jgi:hypothetical protein